MKYLLSVLMITTSLCGMHDEDFLSDLLHPSMFPKVEKFRSYLSRYSGPNNEDHRRHIFESFFRMCTQDRENVYDVVCLFLESGLDPNGTVQNFRQTGGCSYLDWSIKNRLSCFLPLCAYGANLSEEGVNLFLSARWMRRDGDKWVGSDEVGDIVFMRKLLFAMKDVDVNKIDMSSDYLEGLPLLAKESRAMFEDFEKYKGDHFEEFGKIRSKLEKIENELLVAERMEKFRNEVRRRGRFNVLHGIKW